MGDEILKVKENFRRFHNLEEQDVLLERADGKPRTITFSASSEEPYERFFGTEVLVHDEKAIRMGRAKAGAMPLLFNHDVNDPIGMISKMWLDNHRTMVKATLFDTPNADDKVRMIEGGLRNVSIAYRIHKIEEHKKEEIFRVTDWEPFETSIVTVPADPTVGIGREYDVRMIREETIQKEDNMEEKAVPAATVEPVPQNGKPLTLADMEEKRTKAIHNLCEMNHVDEKMERHLIGMGLSVEEATEQMLLIVKQRGESNPKSIAKLDLTGKETQGYSFLRAVQAIVTNNWNMAPVELECTKEIQKRLGKAPDPQRFFVPYDVLEVSRNPNGRRDLQVATPTAGGHLVETSNQGFIDMLRNKAVAFSMGARRLSGLVGNVTIPRQTAAATAYWLANESTAVTESQQTFDQVSLSPNTVAAYTEISRQLMLQSNPSAEQIVTNDLSAVTALALDKAVLHGAGGSEPQGIIGTSGVGSVAGGTLDYAKVLEFQTDVAATNHVPVSAGYVSTPVLAAKALSTARFSNTDTPLLTGNVWSGVVSGFPFLASNQVNSGYIVFGDWAEIIVAEWGVLEVEVNPYANFQAGIIGIRAMYSCDMAVRRPGAFSVGTGMS